MKWIELPAEQALKEGGCVPATIHYHDDKNVWLKPVEAAAKEVTYEALETLWRDIDLITDNADKSKVDKYNDIVKLIVEFNANVRTKSLHPEQGQEEAWEGIKEKFYPYCMYSPQRDLIEHIQSNYHLIKK